MIISKKWSMPNSETFSIKPIRELIDKYREEGMVIVDPFARNSDIGTITNDLDPETKAMYHKDATDFLCHLDDNIADMVLYDPPYSARQVSESYKRLGGAVDMQTTQSSYWARQKKEIARITKKGGVVITCAWNSGGIGAGLGFEQHEILLVAHGGWHNDTIVTVERKMMDGMHDSIPILMGIKKLDDMSPKKQKS
nr:MAG TPA: MODIFICATION METHYLASE RSRI [Caudoviricetes sp.]